MNNAPELKKKLSAEDADLIEKLILEYDSTIRSIVYNKLGQVYKYLAEETISEMYMLMCDKIDILKTHPCPKAWIIISAKHSAETMIHKYKKDLKKIEYDETQISDKDITQQIIYEIWMENKIPEKLIETLTKREREIYHKRYIEGKAPKEIAKELGISVNTVRNIDKSIKDKIKYSVKRKNLRFFIDVFMFIHIYR